MKFYKNNNGYTLLIAVCALLIFSVIGLSLVSVTANGLKKNESREFNVLATDLADKGISYAVSDFQFQLENLIKTPIGKTAFGTELDKLVGYNSSTEQLTSTSNKYRCGPTTLDGLKIDSSKPENYTNVCIQNVEMIKTNGGVEEKDRYKRLVTFKSTGVVDGKFKETYSKVILGTDAIPDQLKYAISSNNGSVHIYGGAEIQGDIKSAADITLHNQGYTLSGTSVNWVNSVYPRILPAVNTVAPKIIIPTERSVYRLTNKSHLDSESKVLGLDVGKNLSKYQNLDLYSSQTKNFIQNSLFHSPSVNVVQRELDPDNIEIKKTIQDVYDNNKYTTFSRGTVRVRSNVSTYNKPKETIFLIGDERRNELIPSNFIIEDTRLNLSGQFYVNGNLIIDNSTVNSDAIIYVNGDVDITDSVLNGKSDESTLIIFATGKIKMINISKYSDSPSKIKGFFYSEETVNMFGSISNIELQGGISGKSVVLSAIRGRYTSSGSTNTSSQQQRINSDGTPNLNSRLKIIYDENLIQSYTSFKRDLEEEFITSINDPEIIERY